MSELIIFLTGVLVGGVNAIAGGGMLIGFPVLIAFGTPAIVANATSGLFVLPGNLAATWGFRKYLKKVPRYYLWLLLPVITGGTAGAILLRHTSPERFNGLIPILILLAVILFAFQPFLYKQLHKHVHSPKHLKIKIGPLIPIAVAVFIVSIYGGFFGAGFGFIMLAFLGFTGLHSHIHRMNALKCVTSLCLSITTLLCLSTSNLIDWKLGLIMGAGSLIGGHFTAKYSQKIATQSIRAFVVMAGVCAVIYLGFFKF